MNLIHNIVAVIFFYSNFASLVLVSAYSDDNYVDLPESHLPYYFNSFPKVIEQCLSNSSCAYRTLLASDEYDRQKCWGYEAGCKPENAFSRPKCAAEKPTWIKTYDEYVKTFYDTADFGELFFFQTLNLCHQEDMELLMIFNFRLHSKSNQ